MRLFIVLFFLTQSLLGKCQQQNEYHNSAAERLKNKSWKVAKYCINEKCHPTDGMPTPVSYFQERDIKDWVGEKYKNRLKYTAVTDHNYELDSLNNYRKNFGSSHPRTWLLTDSTSNKEGSCIVYRHPSYEEDGSGIADEFFEISFLSDTEFVLYWSDQQGARKSYNRLYSTPSEFYIERKIAQPTQDPHPIFNQKQ